MNILFLSENKSFIEDMKEQMSLYAKEYDFHGEYDPETIYGLVVLDDRADVLEYIREHKIRVPLIYFSSKESKLPFVPSDVIIKKPFALDNFLDVLKSRVNTFDNSAEGSFVFNDYELFPVRKEIVSKKSGDVVKLTEKEIAILKYLYNARGRIVSKTELLEEVWGYSPESTTHTIETHIYRLRSKVEKENQPIIITEDGGYKAV